MRLKSIKLAGFKSFVDPTQVNFATNMSAVVGPNGCGKSNIIDAVRWVMGESSAKTLRGESMTDVIFNGTTHRQQVGQASIELIFDNSDHGIGGEYAAYGEISVRRMVSRDGGSDYFLNGAKCRRRDITDLFLGTGLGPRSYAIIEQGMISRLIESRPEDLRVFIEEAAGISKYKERRRETENRMRRTVENLDRLTDLREELERNLAHLQRQAQAAGRYAEFKEEERELKAQLLALQWRELQQNDHQAGSAIGELEVKQEALRADYQRISARIEALRVEYSDATDSFNAVQANYYTVGGEVTRVEQALRFEQEKRAGINEDLIQTRTSLQQAQGHLTADRERLEQWQHQLTDVEPELMNHQRDAEEASVTLSGAEEGMGQWQSGWDTFNQRAAGPKQTSEVQQSRIVYLEQVLRRAQERMAKLDHERSGLEERNDLAELDALDEKIQEASDSIVEKEAALEACQLEIQGRREVIETLRGRQDEKRSKLQQLRGQESSLLALQDAATADSEAAAMSGWLSEKGQKTLGSLFEALSVTDGWAQSVEQVLGSGLTAARVENLSTALSGGLQSAPAGLFAVADRAGSGGRTGTLAEKVSGPAVLDHWLGNVYTAADLESALALLPTLAAQASVITPDGHWLGEGWVRTRSAADAATGVIERSELLGRLSVEIELLMGELATIDLLLNEARDSRAALEHQLGDAQRSLKQVVNVRAELTAERRAGAAAIEQIQQRRDRIDADLSEARSQFNQEQITLVDARAELSLAIDQMESDGSEREQLIAQRDELRAILQRARETARESRDLAHRSDMQSQHLKTQIQTVAGAIERLEQQVEQLSQRQQELAEQLPSGTDPDAALKSELEGLLAARVQAESSLTEARQLVSEKEHGLRDQEQKKVAVEHQLQTVHSDIESRRLAQVERKVRIENLERQLGDLDAVPNEVVAMLPEDANEPEWQVKVERIAARITRLGPINLAAIDECGRASERKDYLDMQNEDLVSALDTLENAIRKIDKETRARFRDTFEQVNAGFSELFPRVFGGGTASLEMTGDDLLDTGVAIMARPPGKKNSTIHLLSGGEKAMTAIALVFSIFQLNPAPFCMLDEVDAPLDDANVGRYVRMVKEMSEKVQFIFITHNKITMEAADQLMGVTMHEPGVSRLVTVDIEEAAQLAAS